MTNFDKWKQERIKEIEDMDIDKAVGYIGWVDPYNDQCKLCIHTYNEDCDGDECEEGIKAYLDMEVEE